MLNKRTEMILVLATLIAAFAATVVVGMSDSLNGDASQSGGQSDVTINLVESGYAYTVDESSEPSYITDATKTIALDNGSHTVKVYRIVTGDDGSPSYAKIREKKVTVSGEISYTISKITVELGNEGYTSADYNLTATIMDYYGTKDTGSNTVTYDGQAFSYCGFSDETFDILIKPKDSKLKPIHIVTMTGGEDKSFSATLDSVDVLRITVPDDVTVDMKVEANRTNRDYTRVDATVNNDYTMGNVKAFEMGDQMKYLTLSGDGYFTNTFIIPAKTTSARQYIIDKTVLEPISGIRDASYINRDPAAYWNNNNANILTDVNFENFLGMNLNETRDISALRAIFTIQPEGDPVSLIGINIYVAEPPYKYAAINLDGTPSDVVTFDGNKMTAVKEGTAIVSVTYDAFGCYSFNEGWKMWVGNYVCSYALNTGLWQENTDVFVVNVGGDDSTITTNMTVNEWLNPDIDEDGTYKYADTFMDEKASAGKTAGNFLDSELDALYYLEGEDGYHYSFTPESGCSVDVYNPEFKDGKLTGFRSGTVTEQNGTFTVVLTEGRNIIKVEKDGNVTYQVATAKKTTRTVEYIYNTEEGKLYPGDQIKITFGDLFSPLSRTTLYNTATYLAYYESNGKEILSKFTNAPNGTQIGSYDFGYVKSKHTITITIPDDMGPGEHTLNGTFHMKGFGNPLGNHHSIGNNIKDNSAPGIDAFLGVLPGVTFTVADYGTITYETGVSATTGTEFSSSEVVNYLTEGKVIDTLVVEKGETITYVVNTINPVHTSNIMQSCPDGWSWSIPDGVYESQEITYTFTATESVAPKITFNPNIARYSFTVEIVVISDGTYSYTENVTGSTLVKDSSVIAGFSTSNGQAITMWNTKPDMSGTYYKTDDTYSLATSTEKVTLYAAAIMKYDVAEGTFSLNNGDEPVNSGDYVSPAAELTLAYSYAAESPTVLLLNGTQVPIDTKTSTYTFVAGGDVEITSSDAKCAVSWTEDQNTYTAYYLSLSDAIEDARGKDIILLSDAAIDADDRIILGSGMTLTIPKDVTLTISEGAELSMTGNAKVSNKGAIVNDGTIKVQKNKISGTVTGDGSIQVIPFFNVGDTLSFTTGTGTVDHTSGWDKASFNKDATTKMTFTVAEAATGLNDWDVFGTVTLTDLTFSSNADLVYIPSYFIGKLTIDGVDYLTYCKVTAISDEAMAKINGKTIKVVLPQALKGTTFSESVTVLTGSHYTDPLGNVYYYDVVETSPVWYNGYTTYGGYAYTAEGADSRYCEQGNVTKVVFKDGLTATTTGLSTWAKSPLASSDEWIGSASSWGDIIGLVVLNDFDLSDESKYQYACNIEFGTGTVVKGGLAMDAGAELIIGNEVSIKNVYLAEGSKIIVTDGGNFTGMVHAAQGAMTFTAVSPTDSSDYEISVKDSALLCTANGSTTPVTLKYGVRSAEAVAFSSDSIVINIDSYDGATAPAGKVIVTYSAYVEVAEGVMLNPFLTMIEDVDAGVTSIELQTEHTFVSCSVSYCYKTGEKTYYTAVKDARAPAVAELELESDLAVEFDGEAVADGDLLPYGNHVITAECEGSYKVNGVEWKDGDSIFYYGQKITISKA